MSLPLEGRFLLHLPRWNPQPVLNSPVWMPSNRIDTHAPSQVPLAPKDRIL